MSSKILLIKKDKEKRPAPDNNENARLLKKGKGVLRQCNIYGKTKYNTRIYLNDVKSFSDSKSD